MATDRKLLGCGGLWFFVDCGKSQLVAPGPEKRLEIIKSISLVTQNCEITLFNLR